MPAISNKVPRGVLLLTTVLACWCIQKAAPAAGPPRIIFILADDLGYGDLGCYGQTNFQTPHIDRMAAEGLRFTQHYAGSTVCAPSRACLLTGQHTGHVWQRANGKIHFRSDPRDLTIATMLKRAGYRTAMIGKSGVACNDSDGKRPNKKGFDHFFGYVSHTAAHRYYPTSLWRNGKLVRYTDNQGKAGKTYSGDLFREDALAFIDANRREKFFLFLALQQPHADLAVPDLYRKRFAGKFQETPHPGGHYRAEPEPKATYAGMISHLDETVGAVLHKLRELGIERETLVLFSSDNGPMSEGGWDQDFFNSSGPLRGGKRDLYEGGVRVPLIARW
ncbi:MAG: sulfatase-like hydrolase/transferase, partial [Planctomycetota bacterium]